MTPGPLPASTISPGSVCLSRARPGPARRAGVNSSACASSCGAISAQSMSVWSWVLAVTVGRVVDAGVRHGGQPLVRVRPACSDAPATASAVAAAAKNHGKNADAPEKSVPRSDGPMDDKLVERFLEDGFVKIEGAFPPRVAESCARLLWRETGYDPDDPGTWKDPCTGGRDGTGPVRRRGQLPGLHEAFDLLVGERRWAAALLARHLPAAVPARGGTGRRGLAHRGQLPPRRRDLAYTNLRSRDRALLMLFLFSEVDRGGRPDPHPGRLPPRRAAGAGAVRRGGRDRAWSSARRWTRPPPTARSPYATGSPGDVYLCHPFLVHAAQPHHGTRPRFMAQPPLHPGGAVRTGAGRRRLLTGGVRDPPGR